MKKIIFISGILLLSLMADALTVSPTKITQTIKKGEYDFYEVTITNDQNQTESVTISSSDTSIVISGLSSISIPPNKDVKFYVILRGKAGLAHIKISNSESLQIPVEVSITAQEVGFLEPTFTMYKRTFEEGVTTKMRLSLRNHYPEKIEIRDAIIEDNIVTASGVSQPIGYEGSLGYLNPEEDLTLDIIVNTVGLDVGVYTPKLIIVYYYQGVRYETKINFEINVIRALTPTEPEEKKLKDLDILFSPESPKVGDTVAVNLVDADTRNWIEGNIRVTEKDLRTGEKRISYVYSQPILVGKYEYCINASKEGYNSREKCFKPTLQEAKIKIVPPPELNRLSVVSMTDLLGHAIPDAELTIDGETYENQASITFDAGKHTITGKAEGYKEVTRTFEIKPPFSYTIINDTDTVGKELVISFSYSVPWSVECDRGTVTGTVRTGSGSTLYFTPEKPGDYYVVANEEIIHEFTVKEGGLFSIPFISIPWWGYVIGIIFAVTILYRKYKLGKEKEKEERVGYGLGGQRKRPSVLEEIEEEEK